MPIHTNWCRPLAAHWPRRSVMHTARSIGADEVVAQLEAFVQRGAGVPGLCGWTTAPELTSHAAGLVSLLGRATVFIEPGCPWQNPFVESFHARLRDELQRRAVLPRRSPGAHRRWLEDYNQRRPHSSLRMLTPGRVRRQLGARPGRTLTPAAGRARTDRHRSTRPPPGLATGDPSGEAPSVPSAANSTLAASRQNNGVPPLCLRGHSRNRLVRVALLLSSRERLAGGGSRAAAVVCCRPSSLR